MTRIMFTVVLSTWFLSCKSGDAGHGVDSAAAHRASKEHDGLAPVMQNGSRLKLEDPKVAMPFLESSATSLKNGEEDCAILAKETPTIGALVQKYRRMANDGKVVRCELKNDREWSCEAEFVYKDVQESEKDFAVVIRLKIRDADGQIHSLACFIAG